jgi:ADP-ribose pyrophosphatase YjhB (NUDIX family)
MTHQEDRSIKSRCIFLKDGKILLCRTVGLDYYFFPGGSLMAGESQEEVLAREIGEEFNSGVKNLKPLTTIENTDFKETITMFSGDLVNEDVYGKAKMKLADGSNIEAEWVPVESIKKNKVKILPEYDYLGLL